jgi:ribonuclease R
MNTHIGTISINTRGKGFVRLESRAEQGRDGDVPVEPEDIGSALPNDIVDVELYTGYRGQECAKVVAVREVKKNLFVGNLITLADMPGRLFFEPDDKRANVLMELHKEDTDPSFIPLITPHLKVQVRLDSWTRLPHEISRDARADKRDRERFESRNPAAVAEGSATERTSLDFSTTRLAKGILVKIIGERGQNNTEMEAIVIERGFDTTFAPHIIKEAEQASVAFSAVTDAECAKRRDMRGTFTCTIDPVDAKDFDDALSIRPVTDAERAEFTGAAYEIGVHIADVSHYVREGTDLDAEARKRAFSVYLVDRTIPMLPSVLSNGACSLNPHEDRFAFSAVFIVSAQGEILHKWFGKTIIYSDKRFSYEEAQDVLTSYRTKYSELADGSPELTEVLKKEADALAWHTAPYGKELLELNRIAKIYLKQKKDNGAIDFETTEIKFKLDEHGRPIEVYKKERVDTHRLVEEYMLLANREVALFIKEKNKDGLQERPGVYRVHDRPDPERIKDLGIFVRALGFDFPIDDKNANKVTPKQIQSLLKEVIGTPQETMVKVSTLRSMAKAIYATHDLGHFGLAYEHYTHFTSPIRRYPDLMVHRILSLVLDGKTVAPQQGTTYEKICSDSTKREIEAADAERSSIKYKQVEFMIDKVGQEFDVIISGISDFGIFVQEQTAMAEGLIRTKDLKPDDFYIVDTKAFKITGEKTKTEFHIGDTVHVVLQSANLEDKMLNFNIIPSPTLK